VIRIEFSLSFFEVEYEIHVKENLSFNCM